MSILNKRSTTEIPVLTLLAILIWTETAMAYIDPGSGSAAYQLFLTGILAVAFAVRRLVSRWYLKFRLQSRLKESSNGPGRPTGS